MIPTKCQNQAVLEQSIKYVSPYVYMQPVPFSAKINNIILLQHEQNKLD